MKKNKKKRELNNQVKALFVKTDNHNIPQNLYFIKYEVDYGC